MSLSDPGRPTQALHTYLAGVPGGERPFLPRLVGLWWAVARQAAAEALGERTDGQTGQVGTPTVYAESVPEPDLEETGQGATFKRRTPPLWIRLTVRTD